MNETKIINRWKIGCGLLAAILVVLLLLPFISVRVDIYCYQENDYSYTRNDMGDISFYDFLLIDDYITIQDTAREASHSTYKTENCWASLSRPSRMFKNE